MYVYCSLILINFCFIKLTLNPRGSSKQYEQYFQRDKCLTGTMCLQKDNDTIPDS